MMELHHILLFGALSAVVCCGAVSSEPLVEIPGQGWVKGVLMSTSAGRKFHGFKGIPYAKPPVGTLRFKEPQLPEPFIGVWNSTYFRSQCLQYQHVFIPGSSPLVGQEDCLYLNVYTPKMSFSDGDKSLDVLVTIHGGAFMFGSGEFYGPRYMLDRDVILVTINYRLGPLGFLSVEDEILPGNNGLKDQVAALKWVKKNIAAFGGNPDSVHLIGLSAGGASVHYHYLSPLSKGLFVNGMSVSGTAFCPWALVEKPKEKALKLAELVGCPTDSDTSTLLKCLRQRSAIDIVSGVSQFQVWLYNPFSPFGPVVEPKGKKPFLPANPFHLISTGKFEKKPWLTGVTSHEGLYPAADWVTDGERMRHLDEHFDDVVAHILHFDDTAMPSDLKSISQKIRQFYFGENVIGLNQKEEMTKMCSDRLFMHPSAKAAKLQSKFSPVYQYEFSYRGTYSVSDSFSKTTENLGVSHGDDFSYAISLPYIKPFEEKDKPISELMINMFTSFMKKGKPEITGVKWDKVQPNSDSLEVLEIASATDAKMISFDDFGNVNFWDSLKLKELDHHNAVHDEL